MKNIKNNWLYFIISILISVIFAFILSYYEIYGLLIFFASLLLFISTFYIFKNPFIGIILIIFFLPFERIPSINLGFMNIKINQIIGGITFLYFVLSVLFGKYKIKPFALTWPLLIFWASLAISLFFSRYLPRSFLIFVFIVFTSLLSLLVSQYLDSKEKIQTVMKVLFWSSLIVIGFSIFQFMGDVAGLSEKITGLDKGYTSMVFGFPRIQAFSQEPLYLGNYLLIPLGIFIALFLGKVKDKTISRFYMFLIICALFIILILTVSRGAYVAFAVLMSVIFIFMARKFFTIKVVVTAIITLIIGLTAVFWFIGKGEERALDEFIKHATVEDLTEGESVQGRLIEFQRALNLAQENPVFGIGIGVYGIAKHNYPDPISIEDWDIVNNQYIELLTETGYVGLSAFILLVIVIIWRSIIAFYKAHDGFIRFTLVGLLAAFIATLVQYNFFSTLYIIHIWVLIGLLIATQNLALKNK